jgi:hypothetical protein
MIEGYHAARFWAALIEEGFPKLGSFEIYSIKCNLINGLPPRYQNDRDI